MLNRDSRPVKPAAMAAICAFCVSVKRVEADIRQADQLAAEDLLQHRRGHADHADAGATRSGTAPPRSARTAASCARRCRCTWCAVIIDVLFARRRPAVGLPAGRRHAIAEGAGHHEDEIDRAHDRRRSARRRPRSGVVKYFISRFGKRRADHRAAAEAHDGHAGGHAAPIGKPFDQRRHRRDVAEAEADAADHAGSRATAARAGAR